MSWFSRNGEQEAEDRTRRLLESIYQRLDALGNQQSTELNLREEFDLLYAKMDHVCKCLARCEGEAKRVDDNLKVSFIKFDNWLDRIHAEAGSCAGTLSAYKNDNKEILRQMASTADLNALSSKVDTQYKSLLFAINQSELVLADAIKKPKRRSKKKPVKKKVVRKRK